MGRTLFYWTWNELKHHFLNIKRTGMSSSIGDRTRTPYFWFRTIELRTYFDPSLGIFDFCHPVVKLTHYFTMYRVRGLLFSIPCPNTIHYSQWNPSASGLISLWGYHPFYGFDTSPPHVDSSEATQQVIAWRLRRYCSAFSYRRPLMAFTVAASEIKSAQTSTDFLEGSILRIPLTCCPMLELRNWPS